LRLGGPGGLAVQPLEVLDDELALTGTELLQQGRVGEPEPQRADRFG
jgi:hypothetical protein